jgi:hypothetical protein
MTSRCTKSGLPHEQLFTEHVTYHCAPPLRISLTFSLKHTATWYKPQALIRLDEYHVSAPTISERIRFQCIQVGLRRRCIREVVITLRIAYDQ